MINVRMVNAGTSCSIRADFCVFFPVSGRFPRFKNPVKYASNFRINHIGCLMTAAKARRARGYTFTFMELHQIHPPSQNFKAHALFCFNLKELPELAENRGNWVNECLPAPNVPLYFARPLAKLPA
jgi:hypothetical protein